MAKINFTPKKIADLKRNYLQMNDKQLSALVGSDVKTVKAQLKKLGLVRSDFTVEKLQKRDEAAAKNIEVNDPETVLGGSKTSK